MRKLLTIIVIPLTILFAADVIGARTAQAQNTEITEEIAEHTRREEARGKELWDHLQQQQITCGDLADQDFNALGEYFMGLMMGDSHAAMNAMITRMQGAEGEQQMHIIMGKRFSGCDTSAAFSSLSGGWLPMMTMMRGGWSLDGDQDRLSTLNNNSITKMMNFGYGSMMGGWGTFGLLGLLTWLVWLAVGVLLVVWLWQKINKK